jgi:hypothetical protein
MRGWATALVFCGSCLYGQSAESIVARATAQEQADFRANSRFNYTIVARADGEPPKTWQRMMILGSPYRRLIAINGEPLPAGERQAEERKLRREIARREHESARDRQDRIAKYRRNHDQEQAMLNQMVQAFRFRLAGEGVLSGRPVYVLDATPRPGYQPPDQKARVLLGMRGRLWVDKQSWHWVKVEAKVVQPVEFYGFLAKVGPGTRFELEYAPVTAEVWEPVHFRMAVNARILGVFARNQSEDDRFSHYVPAVDDSLTAKKQSAQRMR